MTKPPALPAVLVKNHDPASNTQYASLVLFFTVALTFYIFYLFVYLLVNKCPI